MLCSDHKRFNFASPPLKKEITAESASGGIAPIVGGSAPMGIMLAYNESEAIFYPPHNVAEREPGDGRRIAGQLVMEEMPMRFEKINRRFLPWRLG